MTRNPLTFIALILMFFTANNAVAKHKGAHHKKLKGHHESTARVKTAFTQADLATADSIGAAARPDQLLNFAQTLIGTPYHFACSNPNYGFDCSGFVGFVFKSFKIPVPRSSGEFAGIGEKQSLADAKPGDIILFTGTQKHSRSIGHVGIVFSNDEDGIKFIHSTSGKEHGVTITTMDDYYHHRFVSIVRVFKQSDDSQQTLASAPATDNQTVK